MTLPRRTMARIIRMDFRRRLPTGRSLILLAGSIALTLALIASLWQYRPGHIHVVDGDAIRMGVTVYRLVGFDTPEADRNARCDRERKLADDATRRLRQLVTEGEWSFARVPCACRPGTEGTRDCNYGRLCGTLKARGRDVGNILISEGLARSYVCTGTRCPQRESWC
jgi:endonuclease YncB( thermonuclease family)